MNHMLWVLKRSSLFLKMMGKKIFTIFTLKNGVFLDLWETENYSVIN